jgi:ketosteroid isomerase-like protein
MTRLSIFPGAAAVLLAACAPKPETPAAPVVAAIDSAAVAAGVAGVRTKYAAAELAGDAAAVAALHTEAATVDIFGAPSMHGNAAILAGLQADYASRKYTVAEITPVQLTIRSNDAAAELGTYHAMHDAKGKKDHEWGRYVVSLVKGTDGAWKLAYVMAFPDSIKPAK